MAAAQAERVCGALLAALDGSVLPATLHSGFRGAANLSTPLGLVTLLSPGRCLQPYAALLAHGLDYRLLEPGVLTLGSEGVQLDGAPVVNFLGARPVALSLPPGPPPPPAMAEVLQRFLAGGPDEGLVPLALGRDDGPYAKLLLPRLEALRSAARARDPAAAAAAAGRMAGCGVGLTPSSDDLLCGYLAALPREAPWEAMARAMARAAARGTNDISAALLLRAGDGLFSEDVLALMTCLRLGADGPELEEALDRVAAFGSSSGRDFLTGLYFGVIDALTMGGICIDSP